MFESYKSTNHHLTFTNEIGAGSTVHGSLEGNGNVCLAGHLIGDITEAADSHATLYIDKIGVLTGDLNYSNLIVAGTVKGSITVTEKMMVYPTAIIEGNMRYKTLDIHPDARVNGLLSCEGLDEAQINSSDVINFGLTKKLAR
jgi:cytoskeletal protein CcmA (bactofilin family)